VPAGADPGVEHDEHHVVSAPPDPERPAAGDRRPPLDVLTWPALSALGCDVVATTRHGGVSTGRWATLNLGLHVGDDPGAVVENRARAARSIGAELDDLVFAEQVHGARATVVGPADAGRGSRGDADAVPRTDALVTAAAGVTLVTVVADCVPVALFDRAAGVLATIHAGWRGTVAGVLDDALAAMAGLGAAPSEIVAAVGPAIGGDRYEVGDDVADAVRAAFGARAAGLLVPRGEGHWLLDLVAATRTTLLGAGVPAGSIHATAATTGPPGPFYSARRDGPTGRFALLARRRP